MTEETLHSTDQIALPVNMPALDGPVAVMMGGNSSERDISLQSGAAVVEALQSMQVDVVAIDTAEDVFATLRQHAPAFVFIALHGAGGEDGTIQAVLKQLGIPFSGSEVLASALAMDKLRSKHLWRGVGLPTADYVALDDDSDYSAVLHNLGGRVFVKPATEGSSFGMSIAETDIELKEAFATARQYAGQVLAERFIDGPEYTVAIVGDQCLPVIRIETSRSFYNYEAKYEDSDTGFFIPCGLDETEERKLQQLAHQAFVALGCSGWGRVDAMRDAASGKFYLLEANTVPGLTSHSLVPMAAASVGISFAQLIAGIIRASIEARP